MNSDTIVFFSIGALIISKILQICWNYTLPELFGLHEITFLQALALLVLFNILFSVFRVNWNQ